MDKNNDILLSIIIPVYNCIQYLGPFIETIASDDDISKEIILVDDGSTDGSQDICDQLQSKYNAVHCIHQSNQGVSAARNHGIRISRGKYILCLDSDDSVEWQKLVELLIYMEENSDIDMTIYGLSFDYYFHGKCYRRDELAPALSGCLLSASWSGEMDKLYVSNSLSPIWNKIIRRNIIEDNHLLLRQDMFLYEDLDFSLRCMSFCNTIYFCSDIIYHYRQSEDEGNAARRLIRIPHIPDLLSLIEESLNEFCSKKRILCDEQVKSILLTLYVILAREKISISDYKNIKIVCDDFHQWYYNSGYKFQKSDYPFIEELLNKKILSMIIRREFIKYKHIVAIRIKNTKIYKIIRR